MSLKNKPNLFKDFTYALKEEINKVTTVRSYNSGTSSFNYRDNINAHFFEWSNIDSVPKKFNSSKELFEFFDKSNISYTKEQRDEIERRYTLYIICPSGSNTILYDFNKINLENQLKKYASEHAV